ncbi:hypothetical protein GOP47_0019325, partial [Adiantum capillus-veneris]
MRTTLSCNSVLTSGGGKIAVMELSIEEGGGEGVARKPVVWVHKGIPVTLDAGDKPGEFVVGKMERFESQNCRHNVREKVFMLLCQISNVCFSNLSLRVTAAIVWFWKTKL